MNRTMASFRPALAASGVSFLLLLACSESPGGTEVRCVTANVIDGGGTVGAVSLRAPVLLGSVVEKSANVQDDLTVTLRSTNQDVTVEVTGSSELKTTMTLDEVEAGAGAASPLEAEGRSGATYEVTVTPGCSSP